MEWNGMEWNGVVCHTQLPTTNERNLFSSHIHTLGRHIYRPHSQTPFTVTCFKKKESTLWCGIVSGEREDKPMVMASRVETLANSCTESIPDEYVRPTVELQGVCQNVFNGEEKNSEGGLELPVIDFNGEEKQVAEDLCRAAEEWGVMNLINCGVNGDGLSRVRAAGEGFFGLSVEEKEKYACKDGVFSGYGSHLATNSSGKKEWEDYFFHLLLPEKRRDISLWPSTPTDYINATVEYGKEVKELAGRVLGGLSVGLGVEEGRMEKELGGGEELVLQMKINYYPRCPQPELALGVEDHTDISGLTIIFHNMVPGLQVLHQGVWVTAKCIPDSLTLFVGDAVEILSNGRYKSVRHRVMVNRERVRISWAVFFEPPNHHLLLAPFPELLAAAEDAHEPRPPHYLPITFAHHMEKKLFGNKSPVLK